MISPSDIFKASILIVDDREANVLLLEGMLRGAGYLSVASTRNSRLVCDLHRECRYDLILLDLRMPAMDGFAVMEGLKAIETHGYLPVLVITAHLESKLRALKAGARDFLGTPFEVAELLMRVRNMIEVRLMQREAKVLYEQIAAEQKVSAQLLLIFRSGPVAVSIWSVADGRIIDANEEHCRFFGCEREEVLGRNVLDIGIWADPKDRERVMQRLLKEGRLRDMEVKLRRRSGEVRDVLASLELIELAGEAEPVAISMFTDITERKLTEAELHQKTALLEALVDSALDGILVVDLEDRLILQNQRLNDLWKLPPEIAAIQDETPRLAFAASQTRNPEEFLAKVRHLYTHPEEVSHDEIELNDGTALERYSAPVRSRDGKHYGRNWTFRDITERKRMAEQLLRSQRMEAIGSLAGGITHDLNNALAPILMASEFLKLGITDPDKRRVLDTIHDSALRGANMVKQILTFARGSEGERGVIQPRHLVNEMLDMARHTFPQGIRIRTAIVPNIWTLQGNPTQLHQILLNLCVNARDAMPNGGVLTLALDNVRLNAREAQQIPDAKPGLYVMLTVSDDGTGMPPTVLARIFEAFFTTKPPGEGTGLGLSTVHNIAKDHDGFLTVESEVGGGATFKVYLPALQDAATVVAAERLPLPMGHGELILVVDDEAAICSVAMQMLQSYGYRVVTAGNGAQAVGMCAQHLADLQLLITDMAMPIMDGPAGIRAMRVLLPKLKIIVATGSDELSRSLVLKDLGVQGFLHKPYSADEMIRTVHEVLQGQLGSALKIQINMGP